MFSYNEDNRPESRMIRLFRLSFISVSGDRPGSTPGAELYIAM